MKRVAKRALGILMAMMMLLTALPSAYALESDIKGHWAEEALQSFVDDGYLAGDGRGHYTPNGVMTRAQFATILNRVVGLTEESSAITGYTDVKASDWYYHELAKALAAGYMSGTSQTTMSPNAAVTRQQAFTMLARYLGLDTSSDAALTGFADEKTVAAYARGPVAAMITAGYVAGTADKKVNPEKQLTRAEGVTVLYRAKAALKAVVPSAASGLKDGVYTGTGAGYGGTIKVEMTVSGGKITKLEVLSHSESNGYFNRAKKLLDTVLEKQGTDGVDTISGATKSSRGILTAVNACISQAKGGKDTSTTGSTGSGGGGAGNSTKTDGETFDRLKDGVYEGEAAGYSGTTKVKVTVSGGKITAVEIVSHGDSGSYFNRAKAVIEKVINKQSTDVDTVSGATYSSWGILNAINNALKGADDDAPITMEVSTWKELTTALGKARAGDTIKLTADITDAGQVDAVSSATATINKAITLDGNGKTISAYDGKVTKNTTDAEGNVTASEQVDATFCFDVTTASGIQIKDLIIDGASFGSKLGGAMYVETGAELTLDNVTFQSCKAGNDGPGNGGAAVYVEPHRGGTPVLTAKNCTFANNVVYNGKTGRGGAVYGYNANVTLEGCTFTGNKAGYGGAVAAAGSTKLMVKDCTFDADNEAEYGGDDIYIFDGYTFYKKNMAVDSKVSVALSGNKHNGTDGTDFTAYRVIRGRVLGEVLDTENIPQNTTPKTCEGSSEKFLYGHDLTFAAENYDRTANPTESQDKVAAVYDASAMRLKAAENVTETDFAAYISKLSGATVNDTACNAAINANGFVDINVKNGGAYVFDDLTAAYTVVAKAEGYEDVTCEVTIPETIYAYASLTYAEYWAAENVYLSGTDMTASNTTEADRVYTQGGATYEEHDKGAFDAVTRATTNHGLHRGSFQQSVTIYTKSGDTYQPLYWTDGSNFVDAKDGNTYNKGEIGMTQYKITGIKYVPVAVAAADYRAFCAKYTVTQNGEALLGGYTEKALKGYSEAAFVTAETNGLKAATLSSDGETWSFGARKTGTDSGLLGQAQQTAANVTTAVTSESQFGDFIRADITGDGYGALGSRMQTVLWQYKGDGDTVQATYGTKFAADDWMHSANGIQLGLTESLRCRLPEGTTGTGKWIVTVYALGYEDYSFEINVTASDIHGTKPMTADQKTQLEKLKDQAGALLDSDAGKTGVAAGETKWTELKKHYDEAAALLANDNATYGDASDLLTELPNLIKAVQPAETAAE